MLFVYFIAIAGIAGIYAQLEIIGPTPTHQTVMQGTNHTLTCRRANPNSTVGSISWTDVTDGSSVLLYLNEGKQTIDSKYTNFDLEQNNPYDLMITNITVEDEGSYVCQNTFDTDGAVTVAVTVEGAPLSTIQPPNVHRENRNDNIHDKLHDLIPLFVVVPGICVMVAFFTATFLYDRKSKGLPLPNSIGDCLWMFFNQNRPEPANMGFAVTPKSSRLAKAQVGKSNIEENNTEAGNIPLYQEDMVQHTYMDTNINKPRPLPSAPVERPGVNISSDPVAYAQPTANPPAQEYAYAYDHRLPKESSDKLVPQKHVYQNVLQTQMKRDPPTPSYERPATEDPVKSDTAQDYIDLNPHTREKTEYQELNPNTKSPQGVVNSGYEEMKGTKEIPKYENALPNKPREARRGARRK